MLTLSNKVRQISGTVSAVLGAFILVLASVGHWTSYGSGIGYIKRDWERFEPSLVTQVKDYAALVKAADAQIMVGQNTEVQKMQIMFDLIVNRFTHKEAQHTLASNWILYLAGYVHHTFWHIWDPDRLVSQGYSLFCDQSSFLLLHVAMAHGIQARQVGLRGHVVMEAWYDSDWHLYDPDLEVIPINDQGQILSLEKLSKEPVLLEKYYGPHEMVELFKNRQNHLYIDTQQEARFEWKGNILAIFEKITEVLKFVIPAFMLVGGYWLAKRVARQEEHHATLALQEPGINGLAT